MMKEQVCGLGSSSGLSARDKHIHLGETTNNNLYRIMFACKVICKPLKKSMEIEFQGHEGRGRG
jgi:hypothetical protein